MTESDDERLDDAVAEDAGQDGAGGEDQPEAAEKLNLDVSIESRSACQRHITVTVPREDIDRYFNKQFSELMTKAVVPGFRAGRAPRKLVESRFRKDVAEQVKGSLLLDAMSQVSQESELAPISEPDIDPVAIEIPETGPLAFEFDIEVRPEFELPKWKGLSIERPVRDFTPDDVDKRLKELLAQRGRLVPYEGAAERGDYLTVNLAFTHDGETISSAKEETIRIKPVLSFRDGKIEKFDKLMKGATAGATREGAAQLSHDAPNVALRGKKITATFEVLEVKKLELPDLTPALLEEMGGFDSEGSLRDAIKESLERRMSYEQQRRARQQILAALTVAANWDLPPDLLKRQSRRELERSVLELRRSGFSDEEIRAHENELRQNSAAATARALKEHFILERIAEDQQIEVTPADYDEEIHLIAQQSGESPRRVRAQLEKRDLMDTLRNQIVERKAIELILSSASFKDVPYQLETTDAEAIDQSAGGGEEEDSEIPEAKYAGEAASIPQTQERE